MEVTNILGQSADASGCTELKEPPVKTDAYHKDEHCITQCILNNCVFWFSKISNFVKCFIGRLKESMVPLWAGNVVRTKLCLWFQRKAECGSSSQTTLVR